MTNSSLNVLYVSGKKPDVYSKCTPVCCFTEGDDATSISGVMSLCGRHLITAGMSILSLLYKLAESTIKYTSTLFLCLLVGSVNPPGGSAPQSKLILSLMYPKDLRNNSQHIVDSI